MMKRFVILGLLLIGLNHGALAQIALPPLNSLQLSKSAAASGWRETSMMAGQMIDSNGLVEDNSGQVGDMFIGDELPRFAGAYKTNGLVIEGSITVVRVNSIHRSLPVNALSDTKDVGELGFNAAYRFDDFFTVGLKYSDDNIEGKKTTIDATGDVINEMIYGQNNSAAAGSVSIKLTRLFYVGMFMGNVTSHPNDNRVSNNWMDTGYGIAMLTGQPGGFQFRFEYDLINSPFTFKPAKDGKLENRHFNNDTTLLSAEAKFGRLLLSYQSRTTTIDTDLYQLKNADTEIGMGWMPIQGITFFLSKIKSHREEIDYGEIITGQPEGYRIDVGWAF